MTFQRFVAIDWSGAKGRRYAGIAVAECGPGDQAPRLVPGPGGWWSRSAVFDWLAGGLGSGRTLAGIDCAFSLPFAVAGGYFPDPSDASAFDLWDLVERCTADHGDFLGGPFAEHPEYAAGFWRAGLQPDWYRDPHRLAERACRAAGLGSPQSPYKLIGSKQVGRGALAGMRLLRALRAAGQGRVAVWPFEPGDGAALVMVEIYPRLFLRRAGFGLRKIREPGEVDTALAALGSRPAGLPAAVTDHDADALVSAAGLRRYARESGVWEPAALDERTRRQEGWIFGVGV